MVLACAYNCFPFHSSLSSIFRLNLQCHSILKSHIRKELSSLLNISPNNSSIATVILNGGFCDAALCDELKEGEGDGDAHVSNQGLKTLIILKSPDLFLESHIYLQE